MPSFTIRNLPPDVHQWLKDGALKANRTLSQQTLIILSQETGFKLTPQMLAAKRKRRPQRVQHN